MVQEKSRRPSGICKATGREQGQRSRASLSLHTLGQSLALTFLGLGLLDPPDSLGNLKVIVGRQDLDGGLQLGVIQDIRGDLIGQTASKGLT